MTRRVARSRARARRESTLARPARPEPVAGSAPMLRRALAPDVALARCLQPGVRVSCRSSRAGNAAEGRRARARLEGERPGPTLPEAPALDEGGAALEERGTRERNGDLEAGPAGPAGWLAALPAWAPGAQALAALAGTAAWIPLCRRSGWLSLQAPPPAADTDAADAAAVASCFCKLPVSLPLPLQAGR